MPPLNNGFSHAFYEALFKECFVSFCALYTFKFDFPADTAKELVHIGFIKLWENRDRVLPASAKAYLHRTITNAGLDLVKHEKVKQRYVRYVFESDSAERMEVQFDKIDYEQLSADIRKAISRLPQQMRLIFELRRNAGLKYAEIADRLNLSVKTVDTQMSRALAKLRDDLSHYLLLFMLALLLKKTIIFSVFL